MATPEAKPDEYGYPGAQGLVNQYHQSLGHTWNIQSKPAPGFGVGVRAQTAGDDLLKSMEPNVLAVANRNNPVPFPMQLQANLRGSDSENNPLKQESARIAAIAAQTQWAEAQRLKSAYEEKANAQIEAMDEVRREAARIKQDAERMQEEAAVKVREAEEQQVQEKRRQQAEMESWKTEQMSKFQQEMDVLRMKELEKEKMMQAEAEGHLLNKVRDMQDIAEKKVKEEVQKAIAETKKEHRQSMKQWQNTMGRMEFEWDMALMKVQQDSSAAGPGGHGGPLVGPHGGNMLDHLPPPSQGPAHAAPLPPHQSLVGMPPDPPPESETSIGGQVLQWLGLGAPAGTPHIVAPPGGGPEGALEAGPRADPYGADPYGAPERGFNGYPDLPQPGHPGMGPPGMEAAAGPRGEEALAWGEPIRYAPDQPHSFAFSHQPPAPRVVDKSRYWSGAVEYGLKIAATSTIVLAVLMLHMDWNIGAMDHQMQLTQPTLALKLPERESPGVPQVPFPAVEAEPETRESVPIKLETSIDDTITGAEIASIDQSHSIESWSETWQTAVNGRRRQLRWSLPELIRGKASVHRSMVGRWAHAGAVDEGEVARVDRMDASRPTQLTPAVYRVRDPDRSDLNMEM